MKGKRISFDPEWNPIRAASVKTMVGIFRKEGVAEGSIAYRLRQAGYLSCEIRWALGDATSQQHVPPLDAKRLKRLFESTDVARAAPAS